MPALPPLPDFVSYSTAHPSAQDKAVAPTQPPGAAATRSPSNQGGHQGTPAVVMPNTPAAGVTDAREKFRRDVAEALSTWQMGIISPRSDGAAAAIFREGLADIIRLRLRIAYMPLFEGLERIQHRIGVLADINPEPWAPTRARYAGYRR